MDLHLNAKKALVLGSSSGIGKAIAQSLCLEGVDVCLCARNPSTLEKVCAEIGATSYVAGDLSKKGEGRRVTEEAFEKLGGLDILVTNSGGPSKGKYVEVTEEEWETDFQSLWLSVVESTKVVLPHMQRQNNGRILMITSLAAKRPIAGLLTSNGLRAGLEGLAKSIAMEYSRDGITVNLLLPGYTDTERLKELKISENEIKSLVPAGRLADPKEIADLATFLASEKGAYITAQSIAVDGGSII